MRKEWISAGDVGQARFCARSLYLKERGVRPARSARASQARGDAAHERRTEATVDRRCFVASCAFGPDHPITAELRQWRDEALLPAPGGRALVRLYYALSPALTAVLGRFRWFRQGARLAIRHFVMSVVRRG